jgi:hypothetical protein
MNSKLPSALALLVIALGATPSFADITQSTFNASTSVPLSGMGQSFTADATVVNLISAMFVVTNNDPSMSVTAQLYSGSGYGGPLLDTDVINLPNVLPTNSPLFFDFAGTTLTNGNVYSIRLTPTGALTLQAANTSAYPGGTQLDNVGFPIVSFDDWDFRFTIHGESVPEPMSFALIGFAAILICGRRPRK